MLNLLNCRKDNYDNVVIFDDLANDLSLFNLPVEEATKVVVTEIMRVAEVMEIAIGRSRMYIFYPKEAGMIFIHQKHGSLIKY
ncbi:hypothetical protein RCL_jg13961.t1 [Rhizophagus clarus]|uniref:Uncharacterized protein n=1 Tax=Rhizophagus clarus TaxID=94130 RepID=A0A8H3LSL0_9GLOM|nr:hypothetical protein RCL_jg13961.t1 [Rhizophagus clarus]